MYKTVEILQIHFNEMTSDSYNFVMDYMKCFFYLQKKPVFHLGFYT